MIGTENSMGAAIINFTPLPVTTTAARKALTGLVTGAIVVQNDGKTYKLDNAAAPALDASWTLVTSGNNAVVPANTSITPAQAFVNNIDGIVERAYPNGIFLGSNTPPVEAIDSNLIYGLLIMFHKHASGQSSAFLTLSGFNNQAFSLAAVNTLLDNIWSFAQGDGNGYAWSNCSLDISGGTSAAPTTTALASLLAINMIITTNS